MAGDSSISSRRREISEGSSSGTRGDRKRSSDKEAAVTKEWSKVGEGEVTLPSRLRGGGEWDDVLQGYKGPNQPYYSFDWKKVHDFNPLDAGLKVETAMEASNMKPGSWETPTREMVMGFLKPEEQSACVSYEEKVRNMEPSSQITQQEWKAYDLYDRAYQHCHFREHWTDQQITEKLNKRRNSGDYDKNYNREEQGGEGIVNANRAAGNYMDGLRRNREGSSSSS